jgi:hypothetical protein
MSSETKKPARPCRQNRKNGWLQTLTFIFALRGMSCIPLSGPKYEKPYQGWGTLLTADNQSINTIKQITKRRNFSGD